VCCRIDGRYDLSVNTSVNAITASYVFFFNDTATTGIYTLSLHDALPISALAWLWRFFQSAMADVLAVLHAVETDAIPQGHRPSRSEEHTSELQSPCNLVCRLLLEKKKKR